MTRQGLIHSVESRIQGYLGFPYIGMTYKYGKDLSANILCKNVKLNHSYHTIHHEINQSVNQFINVMAWERVVLSI